jgi:acetyl esterase
MTSSPVSRHDGAAPRRIAELRLRGQVVPLRVRVHWPAPSSRAAAPLLVLFSGGAGEHGLDRADALGRTLSSRAGVVVVSVPDVAVPDVAVPAGFHDAAAALEWVADHGAELDADPGRLLVAGEGAGGGLAAAVALHARDHGWPALARQVLVFPHISRWLAGGGSGGPVAAPPWPSLAGVAPATVLTGGGPRPDDGRRYAARLRLAGVEVEELRYGGRAHAGRSHGDGVTERVLADLAGAMRRALGARAPPAGPGPAARLAPAADHPGT